MENATTHIKPLLERSEEYIKTGFELNKLKLLAVFAESSSTLLSRLILVIFVSLFILSGTIALALWLGEVLGKNYFGFLLVTAFYGLVAFVVIGIHHHIKRKINTVLIKQMFNS